MRPILKKHQVGELVVSTGAPPSLANAVSEAVKSGELKKIVAGIYTTSVDANLGEVLRRNLYIVLGILYPGAVISHRSALEGGPTKDGRIVLSYKYNKKVKIPGMTVHLVKGEGPLAGDMPFAGGLYLSSPERAWLANFQSTRTKGGFKKTLSQEKLEELLDDYIRLNGENAFKEKVENLHKLAKIQGLTDEASEFQTLAGTLLGTRSATTLISERAQKRAAGMPIDPERVVRFERLFQELYSRKALPPRLPLSLSIKSSEELATLCFFDAYFSNYIEGTRFEVDEARAIAFDGKIPEQRPDGHDVIGTFQTLVTIANARVHSWQSYQEMILDLRRFHEAVMKSHPDKRPGEFKTVRNYAGSTAFVDPELINGTLQKGFELYQALESGFAKAVFLKFLIAEVHPFVDGNGRMSRIAMNREFYAAGELPIIIPTVYRLDYLGAIKKLTKTNEPFVYIKMMRRAQAFTASLDYSSFDNALLELSKAKAFSDDPEDVLLF